MLNSFSELEEAYKNYIIEKIGKSTLNLYFPKIRRTLIPYLSKQYAESRVGNIVKFLKTSVTEKDLIESAVEDIKRIKAERGKVSEAALKNYIIAFRQFFDFLAILGHENHTLMLYFSMNPNRNEHRKSVFDNIEVELENLNIILEKEEKDPPLAKTHTDEAFKFLIGQLDKIEWRKHDLSKSQSLYQLQYITMIKLFLLLGLKPQKLYSLRMENYDSTHRQMIIDSSNIPDIDLGHYRINLPNEMSDQLSRLKSYREYQKRTSRDFLFTTKNGQQVDQYHLPYYLNRVRDRYVAKYDKNSADYSDGKNPFTQTGLQKFGVIQMIRRGLSSAVIRDVTDIDVKIYDHCQMIVLEDMENNSRYFDSELRAVPTFDFL